MKKRKKKNPTPIPAKAPEIQKAVVIPPREIHTNVWAKISDRRTSQKPNPFLPIQQQLAEAFSHPKSILIASLVAALLGLCGGLIQGHFAKQKIEAGLKSDYLASINPYTPHRSQGR